jgi:cyclic-di-AMP phosphodiesterase PgpH
MRNFLSTIYKYHSLFYKVSLFVASTLFIVYLFPKGGGFKYDFEKGKVWQNENLYAPFDFAIQKTTKQVLDEEKLLKNNIPLYFTLDTIAPVTSYNKLIKEFKSTFPDSLGDKFKLTSEVKLRKVFSKIYKIGLLSEDFIIDSRREVFLRKKGSKEAKKYFFSELLATEDVDKLLKTNFSDSIFTSYNNYYTTLFYNNLKPNIAFDKEFSDRVYLQEKSKILPTIGLVKKNGIVISKGEVVEGVKFQKLQSLKKLYASQLWSESNYNWIVLGYVILVVLALLMLILFLKKYRISIYNNNKEFTFIFFNIIIMIFITTMILKYESSYLYVVPLCILPLILKAFFDARLGLFTHVITVLLLGFIVPNSYEYMFLQIIVGIITILTVSELYKRVNLFISVAQITIVYVIAYFSFYIIHEGNIDELKWQTFALFLLCGLAMLFAQPLIYIYEKLFGLVSDVSLLELSDTNSKLLKDLANKAPGTFHHSLNVANLAEAAANEIGANAMLIRVGALYHDIGKMKDPTYFIENQSNGINPHNELAPKESARIIIDHVLNGIEIAKKNNIPDRVIDFIRTHHGTSLVYYFYSLEKLNKEEEVVMSNFQYKGPKPFSKETAILMMCDSVEAASKSIKNPNYSKISEFVDQVIEKQKNDGQFLNADITFKEIEVIKKVLKHKLINMYHLRIEYPD